MSNNFPCKLTENHEKKNVIMFYCLTYNFRGKKGVHLSEKLTVPKTQSTRREERSIQFAPN